MAVATGRAGQEQPLSGPYAAAALARVSLDVRRVPAAGLLVAPRVSIGEDAVELTAVGSMLDSHHATRSASGALAPPY